MANGAVPVHRVLIVEDDLDSREVMLLLLRRAEWEIEAVESVAEALKSIEMAPPTHVLLDLMLPDTPGAMVLRHVRESNLPVRVALLTAAGPESKPLAEAMQWRPDAVFHKPVRVGAIEAWLGEGLA
jgi:two-component system, OmpR family, alkaline phosphatase synthesis response regulator PhoP